MTNISYAQKLIDLAKALGIVKIIDDEIYIMENIKKLNENKFVEILETNFIDTLETEKYYSSILANDIETIYKDFYDKDNYILDYRCDLSIED